MLPKREQAIQSQKGQIVIGANWFKALFRKGGQDSILVNTRDRFREAKALENQRDWPRLIVYCQQWVQAEPKSSLAWTHLGNAYQFANQFESAIASYEIAINFDPANHVAAIGIGMCKRRWSGK